MRESYITIQSWMRTDLGLSGNELLTYAVIYGFSQDGESRFTGSRQYIADWCGCSSRTVQTVLNTLVDKGYIVKFEHTANNQKICEYAVNFTPCEKFSRGCEKFSLNNIADTIEGDISNSFRITPEQDDVESHGYSPEDLKREFMQSRKKPKGGNNLYSKCYDAIVRGTPNLTLQTALTQYLQFRLAVKDKPIKGVNQWIGMLDKLDELPGDKLAIVKRSLEKGWLSFYPLSDNNSGYREAGNLDCTPATTTNEERIELARKQGRRELF